jgi:hypothetical protein
MIDAEYFRVQLKDQINRMGRTPTVKMHLTDRSSMILFKIEAVENGYVQAQAFPEDPSAVLRKGETGTRIAVPYESIAWMEITLDSQRERSLGFQLESSAAEPAT